MRLSPQEIDKLSLHQVGVLAQKRLARGVRLNHPEAIALIATQLLELVRDGRHSVAELMQLGRTLLGRRNVMPGVPALVSEVQVEGTFPDGSKLVTVHQPIVALDGDLRLALYGSFLPVPDAAIFSQDDDADDAPGAYRIEPGELEINAGRRGCTLEVSNTGDRAVQVGSHFPFTDVNAALVFDRVAALGMHLDIPAGTAVRFEPGERRSVALVEIGGRRIVYGGSSLVDGPATDPAKLEERVLARGFGHRRQS